MRAFRAWGAVAAACGLWLGSGDVTHAESDLAAGFREPPHSARPHTWWHWMNGNVTREGITADLEAMQRVGIGGAQIFNVSSGIPDGPVPFMSPQWLDLVQHAAAEADRLGIELCLHNCAGWSSSGGPWITPEHAMQIVVTAETNVAGPARFDAVLPQPAMRKDYYRDIAVLAFPTPADSSLRVDDLNFKAGFKSCYGLLPLPINAPAGAIVPRDRIVSLMKKTGADGRLAWDVPAGNWTILRIGHTPTGKENHPAPTSGRGLECDKLSREALDAHWAGGIDPVLRKLGPLAGKALNNSLIDSYEVGCNNWTPRFRDEFIKRRGYDPIPLLPALTGRFIDSSEVTERFLWDFRRTIGDLFAENYFGYFSELCHKHGLMASIEPYDGPFECLQVGAKADILMGEFWVGNGEPESVKLAASAAHTHGIRIVGAESFTSAPNRGKWQNYPGSLKTLGDLIWCAGINRFIFHRYAQQPWMDKVPGMTMGQWGTHFERTNTWWEQSRAWMRYLARAQFLLQSGRFAADVVVFGGEGAPCGGVHMPAVKAKGYDYDAFGTDLLPALAVKDGRVTTPAGMSYALLVLPDTTWMTPALATKVRKLVREGAAVLGPKPRKSPSLAGYPACDAAVARIADEVWGSDGDVRGRHTFGKGLVMWGYPVEAAVEALGVKPDFESATKGASLAYIHRSIEGAEVYFVSNQKAERALVECLFRVAGRRPELWNAETGRIESAPLWRQADGRTAVTLDLEQAGSVFVVFREPAPASADPVASFSFAATATPATTAAPPARLSEEGEKQRLLAWEAGRCTLTRASGATQTVDVPALPAPLELAGAWDVTFQPGRGAPAEAKFDSLISWPDHATPGIKYFSGTATYRKTFELSPSSIASRQSSLLLDLGQVCVIAEVKLNGKDLGILWKAPFRADITGAVRAGANDLEVRVTNLWPNRLIGDEQYPDDCEWSKIAIKCWPEWMLKGEPRPVQERVTFTTWKHWHKGDALLPSGLLGPVVIRTGARVDVK